MWDFDVHLNSYESVREWATTIYYHLQSRNMPLTTDLTQKWPAEATERLRIWINQGCRRLSTDPVHDVERIPPPSEPAHVVRVGRDIRTLTPAEIDEYRARLEDRMQVADPHASSPWQVLCYLHTNWCLHYQEAFLFWHRAYLMYFERLIDCPIPYWNWMAKDAGIDGSPTAGLPQPFKDLTYVHPLTKQTRPNPLRFAAAKDGSSKACQTPALRESLGDADCRWVQRNPLLYSSGDDHRAQREKWIQLTRKFQDQVLNALTWPVFSQAEGWPGYPWANIQTFDPPQPDHLYPNREDFDGLYEQPHDNYHGWIGYDMADNSYTAFDPIFWSYHANIDRMMEVWIRAHPAAAYTASFPIQPFTGPRAERVSEADSRVYLYTTIGDLARDSRAIGYDYGPPETPDLQRDAPTFDGAASPAPDAPRLSVLFTGVRCTHDSYAIDAFLNCDAPTDADVDASNPHYIGRFTRIGMGISDDRGRCIRHGVTRMLDATGNAAALGIAPLTPCRLALRVTSLATGELLSADQYRSLPGFDGRLAWGIAGVAPAPRSGVDAGGGGSCCNPAGH